MPKVLIIGATADIGRALAHVYAKNGYDLVLTARKRESLERDQSDYQIRYGIKTEALELDLTDYWSHQKQLNPVLHDVDGAIMVAGYLGDQEEAKHDWDECQQIIDTNFTGAVSVMNILANHFAKRKRGWMIGISSVAGDRGRASNYYYGSAKAGFSAYLSGLRGRMQQLNVPVLTVKPGFVKTKMIENQAPTPGFLTAKPQQVARQIFKAQQKKKNVLYTTGIWFWVMLVIKLIPEPIFKKLKF